MKASLLFLMAFGFSLSFALQAHAWLPSCNEGQAGSQVFASRSKAAVALDKKINTDYADQVYSGFSQTRVGLRNVTALQLWALGEVNKNSLLREQLVDSIEGNNSQHSEYKYESFVDSNNQLCRRALFQTSDVKVMGFKEIGNLLTVSFQILTREDARWDSFIYGNRFDAVIEIQPAASGDKGFYSRMTSYPQFINQKEVQRIEN